MEIKFKRPDEILKKQLYTVNENQITAKRSIWKVTK